jgi:hypothetical protein
MGYPARTYAFQGAIGLLHVSVRFSTPGRRPKTSGLDVAEGRV